MLYPCFATQDVVVSELDSVVDLCLPEPGLLIPGGEDLDGHALALPLAAPHLAVAPFTCGRETHKR